MSARHTLVVSLPNTNSNLIAQSNKAISPCCSSRSPGTPWREYARHTSSKPASTQPGTIRRPVRAESSVANRVRIDTFAAFFWWLVDSYGRFAPGGSHLRPWFIGSRKTGADFVPEGHSGYTFDELKECARAILGVAASPALVSDVYPLVIVDEHQDIDPTLHEITVLLAKSSNLVLLRGPGQCIYRGLHNFNPDEVMRRTEVDLQPQRFTISSLGIGPTEALCRDWHIPVPVRQ